MPIVSGGSGSGKLSGVTVSGTAASGQVPVASSASAGAWGYPPGFEINYTQITSPINIVSTTESAGTSILAPGALTFDGTAVVVEFFATALTPSSGGILVPCLFEGATEITELSPVAGMVGANVTLYAKYRFTPTAASHTYTVTAFVGSTTGTPKITAGSGGTGGNPPAFVRFSKV